MKVFIIIACILVTTKLCLANGNIKKDAGIEIVPLIRIADVGRFPNVTKGDTEGSTEGKTPGVAKGSPEGDADSTKVEGEDEDEGEEEGEDEVSAEGKDGNIEEDVGVKRFTYEKTGIFLACLLDLVPEDILRQSDTLLGAYINGTKVSNAKIMQNLGDIAATVDKQELHKCVSKVQPEDDGIENAISTFKTLEDFQNIDKFVVCRHALLDKEKHNRAFILTEFEIVFFIAGRIDISLLNVYKRDAKIYAENDDFNKCIRSPAEAQAKGTEEGRTKGEVKDSAESEAEASTGDDSEVSTDGKAKGGRKVEVGDVRG